MSESVAIVPALKQDFQWGTENNSGKQDVEWLWRDVIPVGVTTLFYGRSGKCKSRLAYRISAHITNGEPIPPDRGFREPGTVLVWDVDDPVDTVRGFMEAAGCDMGRVATYSHADENGENVWNDLNLLDPESVARLENAIKQVQPTLVLLSPVARCMGSARDSYDTAFKVVGVLNELAARFHVSIVIVRHEGKVREGQSPHPEDWAIGSSGWVQACRSSCRIGDLSDPGRYGLAVTNCNYSPRGARIEFDSFDRVEIRGYGLFDPADLSLQVPLSDEQRKTRDAVKGIVTEQLQSGQSPGATTADVAEKIGRVASTASDRLHELEPAHVVDLSPGQGRPSRWIPSEMAEPTRLGPHKTGWRLRIEYELNEAQHEQAVA